MISFGKTVTRFRHWILGAGLAAIALAAGSAGIAAPAFADFALAHWQFFKPVTLPPAVADGQLVELTLDREVFLESSPGETDLRLVAGQNREVPYQLVALGKSDTKTAISASIRDLGRVAGEYSTLVADVGGSGNLHSEVTIQTREQNFRRTVVVETSADGQTWATVREDGEIYNFTSSGQEFRVHHTSVGYPQSAARYVRVRVLNGGESPLQITGATVFLSEEAAARETELTPISVSVSREEHGTTNHDLDLGSSGIPASRLSFRSETQNFYRGAGILGSDDGEEWEWLAGTGGSHLYSFDTPKFKGSQLELAFPESRYRYYRLSVDDADNSPLSLEGFTLHSTDRLLRFQAGAGGDYALYYGNPVAEAPVYDLQQVVPYLETENLPVATLGAQRPNEAFTGPDVPLTERLPWLMPTALALAAGVVAYFLYRVVRQARNVMTPPEEEPSP